MSERIWWLLSALLSFAGLAALLSLWTAMNDYSVDAPQLTSAAEVERFLADRQQESVINEPLVKIETGIFIQSLKFSNSTDVNLSGYIWQRFKDGIHDSLVPGPGEAGFILPEQIGGNESVLREAYRYRDGGEEVVGWYFEAGLRQPFEYAAYPFDHKTVWVLLWPQQFSDNVVLVPDFNAYDSTGPDDIFGIEHDIVLDSWVRENTYFDYRLSSYDTNFGIQNYVGQEGFPELKYNFVIKRKLGNAFIVHLLPLFLVAALLYAALLTISDDEKMAERHGFSTSGVIGTCSALFFVVLLAHIQLREQFAGAGIVYLEYFYFLMYGLLVMASAYTFLFSTGNGRLLKLLHHRDSIILKTFYWPFIFFAMVMITVAMFRA